MPHSERPRWSRLAVVEIVGLGALAVLLGYWQWRYRGYVKDDAFISLRYARNLSQGLGLVFNPGDRLEGYTNFLWILLSVPSYWLGVDPLTWVKAMGCLFGQVALVVSWLLGRLLAGGRSDGFSLVGSVLFATSSSVVLWSQGGLEPNLMAVLCSGGTGLAMLLWDEEHRDGTRAVRLAIAGGALLALAGLTRPDAHLFPLMAGLAFGLDALRRRRISRSVWVLAGIIVGVLVPYHVFRVLYFGDLFPNTMYVKASAGAEVWGRGVQFVQELLAFNANAAVFVLAPLSLLSPRARAVRVWGLLLVLGFLLYLVKIGRDEMKWFRLILPVYPLLLALAADGLRQVLGRVGALAVGWGVPPLLAARGGVALAWLLAGVGGALSVATTADKAAWHSGYLASSVDSFMELGRYAQERSPPGTRIVFQDMGAAPYAGGDLIWIDTIGILSRTVGQQCKKHGINPFLKGEKRAQPGGRVAVEAFERAIRDDAFAQEPEWLAFVAYVGKGDRSRFRKRLSEAVRDGGDIESAFRPLVRANGHAQGIPADPRFGEFAFETYWKRNDSYYLVLYRKKGA